MIMAFTGIQTGPRQLELPPNMPVPSLLVNPKSRSLRIASLPFHRASAKQRCCPSSEMPAMPSSPQR